MTFDRELYWARRKDGQRGQGTSVPTLTRGVSPPNRVEKRRLKFSRTRRVMSDAEKAHHERQAREKLDRVDRKERGERSRLLHA